MKAVVLSFAVASLVASGSTPTEIRQCEFLSRVPHISFLPKDWARKAIGADLLTQSSALLQKPPVSELGDYDASPIAVIDTGLMVAKEPDAGARLQKNSPEVDYQFHGTAVAGLIASEKFGIDPKLSVKAFPVPIRYEGPLFSINGFVMNDPLFESDKLCAAMGQAVADPSVRVINLSISFKSAPCMIEAVKQGRAAGKIFVFAAGNEGKVSGSGTEGQLLFKQDPGVIFVGSTNEYGAPASFSNFGSAVRLWAPGNEIHTLASRGQAVAGTSFSAPAVSATIGKLIAMHPSMKVETLSLLIGKSSLRRNFSFEVRQINPYHAARLLEAAKACLDTAATSDEQCLEDADRDFKAVAPPEAPASTDCETWASYYQTLREGFFLTNGAPRFGEAIAEMFAEGKVASESFHYAPSASDALKHPRWEEALKAPSAGEGNAALAFFSMDKKRITGAEAFKLQQDSLKILFKEEQPEESVRKKAWDTSQSEYLLARMEPEPSNLLGLLQICRVFFGSVDEACLQYVESAPREFRLKLAKSLQLNMKDETRAYLYEAKVVEAVDLLEGNPAEGHPEEALYDFLFTDALDAWDGRSDSLYSLSRLAHSGTAAQRLRLYGKLKDFRAQGKIKGWRSSSSMTDEEINRVQLPLAHRIPAKDLPEGEMDFLTSYSQKKDKIAEIGPFLLAAHRAGKGTASVSEMLVRLDAVLAKVSDVWPPPKDSKGPDALEWGDDTFNLSAILSALENPDVAPALADYLLADQTRRRRFDTIVSLPYSAMVYADAVPQAMDKALAEPLKSKLAAAFESDRAWFESVTKKK